MFETEWILQPLLSGYSKIDFPNKAKGTPYYEQILICDEDYPLVMVHIDTFWKRHGDDSIYDALKHGTTIKIRARFNIIDEDYTREEEDE